ncbi:MAG: twitch domain-containing radical SAM protein [Bdellovibrionota bacterium]
MERKFRSIKQIIRQPDGTENYNEHYTPTEKLSKYMKEPVMGANVDPELVACRFKWDYPIINLMSGHVRTCCRVPKQVITDSDIEKYGTDVVMNLPYEQDRRREKILGVTHKDCESCVRLMWNEAEPPRAGFQNFVNDWLIDTNKAYPHKVANTKKWYLDNVPQTAEALPYNHPLLRSDKPEMLEIVLGNVCDLKCTYCSVHYSSQWATELMKFGEINKADMEKHMPTAPEKLQKVFWEWFYDVGRHTSQTINILGGEPTYMPQFYDVLDKLTEAYRDLGKQDRHVELGVLSNMNTSAHYMDKFLSKLPELTKYIFLRLQPSMEAMGPRAEYIRYGLDWTRFEHNIRRILSERTKYGLSEKNFGMGFQIALNTFSVSSLPGFVKWVDSLINEYNFELGLMKNVVSFPRHHNPHILTPDYVKYLVEAHDFIQKNYEKNDRVIKKLAQEKHIYDHGSWESYNRDLLDGLIHSVGSEQRSQYDIDSRAHFFEFIQKMKQRRGVEFAEVYPEMKEFFYLTQGAFKLSLLEKHTNKG